MNIWVEAIYIISQGLYACRMLYQANATKKAKKSITPLFYWQLTLIAQILLMIYGYLLGSISMPLLGFISIPFIFYNMKIEIKK